MSGVHPNHPHTFKKDHVFFLVKMDLKKIKKTNKKKQPTIQPKQWASIPAVRGVKLPGRMFVADSPSGAMSSRSWQGGQRFCSVSNVVFL